MSQTKRVYRLRVWNADGVRELRGVPALPEGYSAPVQGPGSHPYIAQPPEVQGMTLDPITGKVIEGASLVRVIDARVTAPPALLAVDSFEDYAQDPDVIPFTSRWSIVGPLDAQVSVVGSESAWVSEGVRLLSTTLGAVAEGEAGSAYVELVFTGLPANTDVTARVWMRPTLIGGDWSGSGGVDPKCGLRVIGDEGTTEDVYDHSDFVILPVRGPWPAGTGSDTYEKQQIRAANRTTADGELTVRLGIFDFVGGGGIHHRGFFWDLLEILTNPGGEGRVVTRVLTDENARQQLLHRLADLASASLDDCARDNTTNRWYFPDEIPPELGTANPNAVTVLHAGFVTGLKLPRALVWDITLGDSARPRSEVKVWQGTQLAVGANWDWFTIPTCVIGGPTRSAWPSTAQALAGGVTSWRVQVNGAVGPLVSLHVVAATAPDDVRRARNLSDTGALYREALRVADELAGAFYTPFGVVPPDEVEAIPLLSRPAGWFPRLRAELYTAGATPTGAPSGTPVVTTIPVSVDSVTATAYGASFTTPTGSITGGGSIVLYWPTDPDAGMPAQPSAGTTFDLLVFALDITKRTPRLVVGHVTEILADAWDAVGEAYDQDSLDAFATLVPWARAALRFTDYPTLAALESDIIGGPFGVGIARDTQGRKRVFSTLVRPVAATGTITTSALRNTDTAVFDIDESTALSGVDFKFERYRPWTERDGERAADGLVADPYTANGDGAATGALAPTPGVAHRLTYTVPGFPVNADGAPVDPVAFANGQAVPILERRGRGAVFSALDVLPSVDVRVGDEVNVQVAHKPGAIVGAASSAPARCCTCRRSRAASASRSRRWARRARRRRTR